MIYPDLRILLSLLMPGDNTQEASNLLREPEHVPLTVSIIHRLQVEKGLLRYLHGEDQPLTRILHNGPLRPNCLTVENNLPAAGPVARFFRAGLTAHTEKLRHRRDWDS